MDRRFQLLLQLGHEVFGRDQDLRVLLHQFGEVVEETVLRTQKVKLEIPLLAILSWGEGMEGEEGDSLNIFRQLLII